MPTTAVGIDLGTTTSCVGVFKNGKVEIIPNSHGNRVTPSFVAFTDEVRLIGDAAKKQVAMNPKNTVFNVKRLIGQKFNNPEVQKDIEQWSFDVVSAAGDRPMVQVEFKGETKVFWPEEISSMILANLKQSAEEYLGGPVRNAVITVPAYFNDSQRRATKDAGKIAGFNVFGVLNEPTAAAIAYGLGKKGEGKKNVLIYDLGGGTFDVTILTMDNGSFDVKSTAGDVHLGGEDFDNLVVDFFAEEIQVIHDKDIKSNPRALRRLRTACEKAKQNISNESEASIELDALIDGIDFRGKLSCTRFESLCEDLFQKTLDTVKDALSGAKMSKDEIDEVVLVGGSSRIPRIRDIVSQFFDGKQLSQSINPDEAVTCGAAIQAALLGGDKSETIGDITFRDVTPLSLGTETKGAIMSVVIPRNTHIPIRKSKVYHTCVDNQTSMTIKVYEGERNMTTDNNFLGRFELKGITPALRGVTKVEDTFEIDKDGILTVTSRDISNGVTNNITITNETGRLSEADITRMIANAEEFKELDIEYKKKAKVQNKIDNLIHDVRRALRNTELMQQFDTSYKENVEDMVNHTEKWSRRNRNASKIELDALFVHLKIECQQIIEDCGIDLS